MASSMLSEACGPFIVTLGRLISESPFLEFAKKKKKIEEKTYRQTINDRRQVVRRIKIEFYSLKKEKKKFGTLKIDTK